MTDLAPMDIIAQERNAAPLRVLVAAHMDPRLSRGGAEIAAFQLYGELAARDDVEAWFLSAAPGRLQVRDGVTFGQPFGAGSYTYSCRDFDHFIFSNPDDTLRGELYSLLQELRPDVVHLHHYTNFGLEFVTAIRAALPDVRIVMTLHEYLAICNHFGQMVKRPSFALCERSGPRECNGCFPEQSPQDFFLRDLFIKRFFREIDHFIAPSKFLADRYIAWGLDETRITVVENGIPDLDDRGNLPYPAVDQGLTFGFFGQISRLKGFDILLDAAEQLDGHPDIRIEIYGDYSSQPPDFQAAVRERLAVMPKNVRYMGAYDNKRVDRMMQAVHAVLVPSIWWENSPLVIQEALANRRPVICSDIGGMAEKVRDGVDGFHFQVGSGSALAALLKRLAAEPARLAEVHRIMARAPGLEQTTDRLLGLYRGAVPLSV
jgi:glycosyltransferase involved in cell wall biosynthesis